MKIYLCRHGQTTGDIEDRYGGDYEDHLTDEGLAQARGLANNLKDKGIQIIFASPRIRAQETAQELVDTLHLKTETVEDFRERNHYGILTGMIKSEAKAKYPDEVEKIKDYRQNAIGGESYEPFKSRVFSAWNSVVNSGLETVAVISHGGPIRVIFRELLKFGEINIADCAYAIIDVTNGKTEVVSLVGIEPKK